MCNDYIASPLNYIGGKYKLLPQIIPLFPQDIETFVDLFCGGANIGINVNAKKIIFNDNLIFLIDLYNEFQKHSIDYILNFIETRIKDFSLSLMNKDGYLQLREFYNKNKNPLDLFVLIAYSFNHQIRFNNSHNFNNPFGKNRSSFNKSMKNRLINFISLIHKKNICFQNKNFEDFDFLQLNNNDFVYCDPPYLITTGTYNDGNRGFTGWNEYSERKLLALLDELNFRNIRFALSNVLEHKGKTNDILIQWLKEKDYYIHFLEKNYSNSNYQTINRDKNSTIEVLITNYKTKQIQRVLKFA